VLSNGFATVLAWWSGDLDAFRKVDLDVVLGALSVRANETHRTNAPEQIAAWRIQLPVLRDALVQLPADTRLLLEYPLLRLGRRIDAVVVTNRAIFVLEFKVGADYFNNTDRRQVEDYALDLFDFHSGSRAHPVVPILVATRAQPKEPRWRLYWYGVTEVYDASARSLSALLSGILVRIQSPTVALDVRAWEHASYRPVPTIVDAARMLYSKHGVADLANARADVGNLTRTTTAIQAAVAQARANDAHVVIFVTGIPGAGKTLCGLNSVFGSDSGAAFLTGNFPLVFVMRQALERDARDQGRSQRVAKQETESAIQPLMGFLKDNFNRIEPPHEHVIVFDEAQRAWDEKFGAQKFGHAQSEAAMFLDIMRRHEDWAAIVALVGSGQEINTGEAGLATWGEALLSRPDWRIYAAPGVLNATDRRQRLFNIPPPLLTVDPTLHLTVPVRAIRNPSAAPWVDAVILGDAERAMEIAKGAGGVPFAITRSLPDMRTALRHLARGDRRSGLVCSAGNRRLQAEGLWPNFEHMNESTVANWFLQRWPDVRASDALEIPATQFACQGLELDFVGLCWGNDLIRRTAQQAWMPRKFVGTKWQSMNTEAAIAYQLNTYRVLLTRARYETIIWVPTGDADDKTRDTTTFDAIVAFLLDCGAIRLEQQGDTVAVKTEGKLLL
jgi:hypothetical protein